MDVKKAPRKLWVHPRPESTEIWAFMQAVNTKRKLRMKTFQDLYDFSITKRAEFWADLWSLLGTIHTGNYTKVVDESAPIDSIPKWFEGVRLNYAENILFSHKPGTKGGRCTGGKEDHKIALTEVREGCEEIREINWRDLRKNVGRLTQAMRAAGVRKGDRVAIVASNSIDTLQCFLAVTSIGGLFSSSSTDMGTKGILDRLLQIEPVYVFMDDGAIYNGKTIDLRDKMREVVEGMRGVANFKGLVAQPRFSTPKDMSKVPQTQTLASFLSLAKNDNLIFEQIAFHEPFLIVYSSGTTGMPKCIVHSAGGVILSSKKEARLHSEVGPRSVTLQYTTTGWIMYLTSVCALLHGARSVLYDGSPFQPDPLRFIQLVSQQKVTHLGISPRYIGEMQKLNIKPREVADLSSLKKVGSTGMVLSDAQFEWFYDVGFPPTAHLSNISGGTDIAGCFAMDNPLVPVYVGGCQGPCLGTPIAIYDQTEEGGVGVKGHAIDDGIPGELVATDAFPNMPVKFWGKDGAKKYFDSYFARFEHVWTHGDFVMIHPITKGLIFMGRADGVLNPSGIRFGSAEIYNVLENAFPQIADSLCIGQRRPQDTDEAVMLFCLMKPGETLTPQLVGKVKAEIRRALSPRHVPKYIFTTPAIPTTINSKKVELPVKRIVSGVRVKPSTTLANPECLEYYYQFVDVEKFDQVKGKL